MANKHTRTNGDLALEEAKQKRREEVERLRASDTTLNEVIPENWVKRDTAFPPYLQMFVGATVRAVPLWRDERQVIETKSGARRTFVRYHLQLVAPAKGIECRRGPTDDRGTPVAVYPGQVFSIGAYASLEPEMNALMGLEMAFLCKAERPLEPDPETGDPRKFFEFETFVAPETEELLKSESEGDRERLRAAYREARQLARENNIRLLMAAKENPLQAALQAEQGDRLHQERVAVADKLRADRKAREAAAE